jgi:GNAT superfamily N-acetyltransferase
MSLRIEVLGHRPASGSFSFAAYKDGEFAGSLTAEREVERSPRYMPKDSAIFTVDYIRVMDFAKRTGIATKLYEAAAREACKRGARLASTCRIAGAYSNDFWKKQHAKGRAERIPKKGCDGMDVYVLSSCDSHDLSGLRRRRKRVRR